MGSIKVIKPGFLTTIQDLGRFGYQKFGMPVAGAMDEYALRIANLLVGNTEEEACLEITLVGPTLEFLDECVIALTGGDLRAQINGEDLPLWQACYIQKGDKLHFGGVKSGCRAYLAVAGGLEIPAIMGSKSTYLRGQIGGVEGRALWEGDEISFPALSAETLEVVNRKVPRDYQYDFSSSIIVRVVLGPQEDAFTLNEIKKFLEGKYQVTNNSDRMGYRLDGPRIHHKKSPDIISDGIAKGSVQIPGDGLPIVMMSDRQTTGGYTKIATIITPDFPKIAQAKPGDTIQFQAVSIEEAHEVYRQYETKIRILPDKFIYSPRQSYHCNNPFRKIINIKINGKEYLIEIEEI